MKKVGVRSHCERLEVLVVALVRGGEERRGLSEQDQDWW